MRKFIATAHKETTEFQIDEIAQGQLKIVTSEGEQILDVQKTGDHHYSVIQDGQSYDIRFYQNGSKVSAFLNGEVLHFQLEDALEAARNARMGGGAAGAGIVGPAKIDAIMPGKIVAVKVKVGDEVVEGQGVIVLEAMKMENELASPKAGKVTEVHVVEGQSVDSGAILVVIE